MYKIHIEKFIQADWNDSRIL